MSILDVTEDQIFHTLGRGKDPNFKPIEKVRPVMPKPKKTCNVNKAADPASQEIQAQVRQAAVEPMKLAALPAIDESMVKFTAELNELNLRVTGIQTMIKWYILPQFAVVLVLLLALLART
jgi:hypothetical protein